MNGEKDSKPKPCSFCGYVEEHGNLEIKPGIWLCDECLISGEAIENLE